MLIYKFIYTYSWASAFKYIFFPVAASYSIIDLSNEAVYNSLIIFIDYIFIIIL